MPVRIIEQGPDPSVEKQIRCQACGTLFGYLPIDVETQSYRDWDGVSGANYIVKCPSCKRDLYVDKPKGR